MVGVSDGDTITVLDDAKTQHKIRFAGIDAPEKSQPYGERSKQNLSALVFQKRAELRCHKKDRYGREVCAVYESLRGVGLEQIRAGTAWHYKAYQREQPTQERLVYRDEEDNAKARKIGPMEGREAGAAVGVATALIQGNTLLKSLEQHLSAYGQNSARKGVDAKVNGLRDR